MAGGFSIERNKISEFKEYIKTKFEVSDQNFQKNYDLEINLSSVNIELCNNINKLSPFGMGNPKPKFLIRGCIKNYVKKVGQNHLIIGLQDNYGNIVKSIIFNSIDTSVGNFLMSVDNQEFDVICSMQINSWGGQKSAELILEDVIQI